MVKTIARTPASYVLCVKVKWRNVFVLKRVLKAIQVKISLFLFRFVIYFICFLRFVVIIGVSNVRKKAKKPPKVRVENPLAGLKQFYLDYSLHIGVEVDMDPCHVCLLKWKYTKYFNKFHSLCLTHNTASKTYENETVECSWFCWLNFYAFEFEPDSLFT